MVDVPTFTETDFHKSTFSDPDKNCVALVRRPGVVAVRDTKTAFGAAEDVRLVVPETAAAAFLAVLKIG